MHASTITFAALAVLSMIALAPHAADAHGRLVNPPALPPARPQKLPQLPNEDFNRVSRNQIRAGTAACGNIRGGLAAAAQAAQSLAVQPGQEATLTWFIGNADGGGPMKVAIDATGTGNNFKDVQVTQQVDGRNSLTFKAGQRLPLKFQVPQDLQCTGPGGKCLVRVINPVSFISCGTLTTGGAPNNQQPGGAPGAGAAAPNPGN